MKFLLPLIAVSDLERSKAFYKEVLGLDVEVDFRANVTLTGGLSLQTFETWRAFIGGLDVTWGGNDAELYFEDNDFDSFINKLKTIADIKYVHPPMEHSWGQRAVRFYDPDDHIIEVGENISAAARRFLERGMNVAEIAVRMDVKEEYVTEWLSGND